MKCPALAGREKKLKKNRQRHPKNAASLGSLREGAVAVRRLKELAQFTESAILTDRSSIMSETHKSRLPIGGKVVFSPAI